MPDHLRDQIDLIARHEQEFLARRTASEKAGDKIAGFVGSLRFVGLHILLFAAWIGWNTLSVTATRRFDPSPFSLLATLITLEAILLASFILMRQSRMSRRADERDHLVLQILMLTEKELTALLKMNRQIAKQGGLDTIADRADIRELSQHTSIDEVVESIRENFPDVEP